MTLEHSQNINTSNRQQIEAEEKYWYNVLHNNPQISTFPLDYPRNPELPDLEGVVHYQLPPEVSRKLITVSNNSDQEIFVILLASVFFTISQYNNYDEVLVGILPVHTKATGLVNSNVLPVKFRMDLTQSLHSFFTSLKNIYLDAEAHKIIPFRKMQELLGILSLEYTMPPLINTVVLYKNIHNTELIEHIATDNTFSFQRKGDQIELELLYNQNFYCHTKLEQVVGHCIRFLSIALFNPDIQLSAIDLLNLEEKRAIGNELDETRDNKENRENLLQHFGRWVNEIPQNTAIIFDDRQLTFQELDEQTDRIAFAIQKQGIHRNDLIAIIATKPLQFLLGMLGVLKSGAAFLTISAAESIERMNYFIQDSGAKMVICQSAFIPEVIGNQPSANLVFIDLEQCNSNPSEKFQPRVEVNSADLACLIYRESSMEAPRGVLIKHGSLINRLNWLEKNNASRQIIYFLPDTTTAVPLDELLWWSLSGAKIYLLNPDAENVAEIIARSIIQEQPALIHLTPELLDIFNNYVAINQDVPLESLNQVFVGGNQALDYGTAYRFYEFFSQRSDLVLSCWYRQPEITGSEILVKFIRTLENEIIPFGEPLDNTKVYVIDRNGRLQPRGAIGELTVTSKQLADGYLNNLKMTEERFRVDWFQNGLKNFNTGERVKWLPDGRIEFLTFIDKPILSKYEYFAPEDEIEEKLAAIWEEILGVEKVGIYDNFFQLGGNSLLASKFEILANQRGLNVTSQDLCSVKFLKPLAMRIGNQLINASTDYNEKKPVIAKTQATIKLLDIYHSPKIYYPEYKNNCVLNGIRQIIEYYGVDTAPLYMNATLSWALTLTETKLFGYKLDTHPGIPPVLPSHAKYIRVFLAPPRDVHKVWEFNKKKIDQGVPLFIGLDTFYMDYSMLFKSQKVHCFHIAILCGYSNDEKRVYIVDWYEPQYFKGAVALDQFLKARSSDNPNDCLSRFCGIPVGNYWGEVTPGVWNRTPEELLFETLTLSLKQYVERIEPENNVYYGADAWKKLFEILDENKEGGSAVKDPNPTERVSINFLWELHINLSSFLERLKFFDLYLELAAQKIKLGKMPSLLDELHQQINRWENFLPYVYNCSKLDSGESLASFPTIITKFKDLLSLEDKYLEQVMLLLNELK